MTTSLKDMITSDIETIKTMDVSIMGASEYYLRILKKIGRFALLFLFGEFVISLAYLVMGNSWLGQTSGWGYLYEALLETAVMGLPVCLFISLMFLPQTMSKLVIFEHYYKDNLKSGHAVLKKIKTLEILIYNFFFIVTFLAGLKLGAFLVGNFFAFIATLFFIPSVVGMEIERLAIPGIQAFFKKPEEKNNAD